MHGWLFIYTHYLYMGEYSFVFPIVFGWWLRKCRNYSWGYAKWWEPLGGAGGGLSLRGGELYCGPSGLVITGRLTPVLLFFLCVCVCVCVCVLLCFIEPNSTNSGGHGSRGLLIKGLLTWGFRPIHTLPP